MNDRVFPVNCAGDSLTAALNPTRLGLAPGRVWNPSPSVYHRTTPYDLPQRLSIGLRGNDETGAKFSPPPFAVVVESGASQALVAVRADAGFHLWNDVVFDTDANGVRVEIDLEGQSAPAAVAPHVSVHVIAGQPGESRHQLLARGLRQLYPRASAHQPQAPDWWLRPSYCGWGDQVAMAMWLEGVGPERRANAYCTQGLYERWLNRLDEADVPIGTVTIDAGWSRAGVWEPDPERWPDLRGFIARQHERGRKVLLWLATWLWDGVPDEWCVFVHGKKLCADPTNPDYRRFIRENVRTLISPDGFDADGFKVDQLAWAPSRRAPLGGPRFGWMVEHLASPEPLKLAGPGWGVELLYQYQQNVYETAIAAKPDALVTSSTVHPYFHDTLSMVRLHDMGFVAPDIFVAMGARAALSEAALPGMPIDADDWVHSDYDLWLRYTSGSRRLGVPCTLYAERFVLNWQSEPATRLIPLDDLRRIGDAWRASPASTSMQTSEAHA